MPTLRKDKENRWMGRVVVDGQQVVAKMFPAGKKYGQAWLAAKNWEEEQKKEFVPQKRKQTTLTDLEKFVSWGEQYLTHCRRTMVHATYKRKTAMFQTFFIFCSENNITALEQIGAAEAYMFLSKLNDQKSASVANEYRKHLMAGWAWGKSFVLGFPQLTDSPFRKVRRFPEIRKTRYVPPEEDIIKVLQQAKGQNLVILLTLYFTGARWGEVFRLQWENINFSRNILTLTDRKTGNENSRTRYLQMHPELRQALFWWREARPCKVENVFMQVHCTETLGEPFRYRNNMMPDLCKKAGVRPFGFHAIRHKSATITYMTSGLNAAQVLMGHYRSSTTDIYIRCAGLYTDQDIIVNALGNSEIGLAVDNLLKNNNIK